MTVAEMCDWYLTEARAGNILGRKNRPIKASSLKMDASGVKVSVVPRRFWVAPIFSSAEVGWPLEKLWR